jgi:hypothetical protein
MSRAYIYMEHPDTAEMLTLGRLTLQRKSGEFIYAPDYYAQWLRGEELERVRATVSTARMR